MSATLPAALTYADGNFGSTGARSPRDVPQSILIAAQWVVLLAGLVLFFLAARRSRRLPRGLRGWLVTRLSVAGLVLVGFVGWVLYEYLAVGVIPPNQIAQGSTGSILRPDLAGLGSPEQVALAERGRYLYTGTSCALCHGSDGSGGPKISWRPFGTLWTRNISTDTTTGIGAWSDGEIARAIRSGVSRDGRILHWQGMIWDHLSNLDEEDVRALVVYLRTLPPVERAIPPPRPPAPDDCATYTFFLPGSRTPGCE